MKVVTITCFVISLSIPVSTTTLAQTSWTKQEGNPVLNVGPPGSWDDDLLLEPSVLFDGTIYHMWYGGDDGTNVRVGYATSPDGVDWTKSSLNPVLGLGSSGSWEDTHVGHPWVLYDGTIYHMWYAGYDGATFRIGYATSPDGVNWTKNSVNPVLELGSGWESRSIYPESVLHNGSEFQMWYVGLNSTFVGRSGYATSPDGITWERYSDNPILNVGSSGEWDEKGAEVGTVLFDDTDNAYDMWYDSFDGADGAFGYATSDTTTGIADEGVIPDKYDLSQNYPNPFNPETVIEYALPEASDVSLIIYNLRGEEVAQLVDSYQPAGYHKVRWDASNLASGIYFYRLQAGVFIQTRKMLLLK